MSVSAVDGDPSVSNQVSFKILDGNIIKSGLEVYRYSKSGANDTIFCHCYVPAKARTFHKG